MYRPGSPRTGRCPGRLAHDSRDTLYRAPAAPGSRYFVVTALDEAGNESGYSNEVSVTPQP